jgi:hypothetical protein
MAAVLDGAMDRLGKRETKAASEIRVKEAGQSTGKSMIQMMNQNIDTKVLSN